MNDQNNESGQPKTWSNTKSGNNFTASFDGLPIVTIGIKKGGSIFYANHAATYLFEATSETLIGKNIDMYCLRRQAGDLLIEQLLRGEVLTDEVYTLKTPPEKTVLVSSEAHSTDKEILFFLFIKDITKLKKREDLLEYLHHAATILLKTRATDMALRETSELIVPSFADWLTVDQVINQKLELVLLMHKDADKIEWARDYRKKFPVDLNGHSGQSSVVKTGEPVFIPFVTDQIIELSIEDPVQRAEIKKIGFYSVIMAPMRMNDHISGLVTFISSRQDRHFDQEDATFALKLAALIGLALQNTGLNDQVANDLRWRTQSEEKFRFLLDAIPHKMWTSAADGGATFYNKRWYEYTGVEGFKKLKDQIWGIIHPDDLDDAQRRWPEAIKTATEMELEHRLKRYDGQYRWHLSRFTAHEYENGIPALWVGTSTDIHDQKVYEMELAAANAEIAAANEELVAANEEMEAANEEVMSSNDELIITQQKLRLLIKDLEESQARFQLFMDSIPQIAWASAATGEVLYYNRRWYEYTGLSFDETRNWGWKQVIHPDDLDYNLRRLKEIIDSKEPGEFEIREKGGDGIYRWHLILLSPLFNSDGELDQWIGTATDINELKKLQQQRDDFISIASHELRTPLTTLKTSIQLLYRMKDELASAKFTTLIDQANRSSHKMSNLVNDLLNVSRIKESHLALQKQWFVLSELVNACCNPITIAGKHEVLITGEKTLKVYADESAVDQVIVNFLNNAIKYAPGSKQVLITIESDDAVARLSVKDNGPGIPSAQLPFLFDRYYQGGKKDYRNPGLGLGLYISAEIIKKHGGEIGVESILGQGSTFWFTLPAAKI